MFQLLTQKKKLYQLIMTSNDGKTCRAKKKADSSKTQSFLTSKRFKDLPSARRQLSFYFFRSDCNFSFPIYFFFLLFLLNVFRFKPLLNWWQSILNWWHFDKSKCHLCTSITFFILCFFVFILFCHCILYANEKLLKVQNVNKNEYYNSLQLIIASYILFF